MLSLPVADSPHGLGELDFRSYSIPHARISALSIEHDDLDSAIDALVATNLHDDLAVARLKKRRLQIRDEIAGLLAAVHMHDARDETGLQNDASIAVPAAASEARDGSFVFGAFAILSALIALALFWSGVSDFANQTIAQMYVLSLLVAANG